MNKRVGEMDRSLAAGLYPDAPGTHEIFVNTTVDPKAPLRMPRPPAVIVVGLGHEAEVLPELVAPDDFEALPVVGVDEEALF